MTSYLQKSALFSALIPDAPSPDLGMIVVIPAYREDQLLKSLQHLKNCQKPSCAVEVIVIINDSENDDPTVFAFHEEKFQEATEWAQANSTEGLTFFIHYQSKLPKKHAGVGLARKIGMDEAVLRLEQAGRPEGIILCFDADSLCQPNYLKAVEQFFATYPKAPAAAIHYEHPIAGEAFSPAIYHAIVAYELHLRYYIEVQRWTGFPLAYHTVGSSMAVRAAAYQAQGGMNRRKAGEDFYFLHKFIPLDHFGEINTTMVIPSPRMSDRVPFGTGKSIQDILKNDQAYFTYAPDTFVDLKQLLQSISKLYAPWEEEKIWNTYPQSIQQFLEGIDFKNKLSEIRAHTSSEKQFVNRFYRYFNAFVLMKYVHYARDHFYPNVPVNEAGNWMLQTIGKESELHSNQECLLQLRAIQKNKSYG